MHKGTVTIVNKLGLHARAATRFVHAAKQFDADISVLANGRKASGKSIMELMMLAAAQHCKVELMVTGHDEGAAFAALKRMIDDRFGEGE